MEELILQALKKEYIEKQEEQKTLKRMYERLLELKSNEAVKEYLSLKENLEKINLDKIIEATTENIFSSIYHKYLNQISKTNQIYVYLGTYTNSIENDIIHGTPDIRVKRNDKRAKYCLYQDLEKTEPIKISIDKTKQFEEVNVVIFPNKYLTENYYYELQKEFFYTCITTNQEEALKKVRKLQK